MVKTGREGPPLVLGASSWPWKTKVSIDLLVVDSISDSGVGWLFFFSGVCPGRSEGETLVSAATRLGAFSGPLTVSGSGSMIEHCSCLLTSTGGDRGYKFLTDPPTAVHTCWSHHLILVGAEGVSESEDEGSDGLCSL